MRRLLRLSMICAFVSGQCWLGVPRALPADAFSEDALLRSYRTTIANVFLRFKDGAIPLYRSNYKIGDTYDMSMQRLLETGDRCFKKLSVRSTPSEKLFKVTLNGEAAAGFLLGVRSLFDTAAKGDTNQTVDLEFEDVVEETAIEGDWTRSFDVDACPSLKSVVAGERLSAGASTPVVIGTLFRGKRKITIAYGDDASAEAKLTEIRRVANIQANISAAMKRSIVVTDAEPRPLAYAPAFVPVDIGAKQGSANVPVYAWTPYDPKQYPSHRTVLPDLSAAADKGWSWQ
jgi:hypothetical protein